MNDERRRILDMLAAGKITVEQAEGLLKALQFGDAKPPEAPPAPGPAEAPSGKRARSLRIQINDAEDGQKVNVTVPIGLIKFASRFIPKDARSQLNENGIQLDDLLASLGTDEGLLSGETLVEIQADEKNGKTSHIHIKAV